MQRVRHITVFLRLHSGTAGDSFTQHHGYPFTTKDQDNDSYDGNCAKGPKGALHTWPVIAQTLTVTIIDGMHSSYADGVNWYHWKSYHYSARRAELR